MTLTARFIIFDTDTYKTHRSVFQFRQLKMSWQEICFEAFHDRKNAKKVFEVVTNE